MSQPESGQKRPSDGDAATGAVAAPGGAPIDQALAQQIEDFSRPLLEGADTAEATQNALAMGEFFWLLALAKDARSREGWMQVLLKSLAQSDDDRENLRALAVKMVARHEQMFPSLHGPGTTSGQE